MLRIDVLMGNIQYEKSFIRLLSQPCMKSEHVESDCPRLRFLQKVGNDFPWLLLGVLEGLSENEKNKLLCELIQSFGPEVIWQLNSALAENSLGQYSRIEGVSAEQGDGYVCLTLSGIAVNYSGLLQSRDVQEKLPGLPHGRLDRFSETGLAEYVVHQVMNCAAFLVEALPGAGEQAFLSILEQEGMKKAVLRLAEDTLRKNGLHPKHLALRIQPDSQPAERPAPFHEASKFRLSRELEEALLDNAAALLLKN